MKRLVLIVFLFLAACGSPSENPRYRIVVDGKERVVTEYRECRTSSGGAKIQVYCWKDTTFGSFPNADYVVEAESFEVVSE